MKNLGDMFPNPFEKAAEWADGEYTKNNKKSSGKNYFYIYVMFFYNGNLLPREQERAEKKHNLPKAIYTKINTTACYFTMLAFEHTPLFLASHGSNNKLDDIGFWINLGTGLAIDGIRAYYAFKKGKRSPGIGVFSLAMNVFHYSAKAIKKKIREKKGC